MSVAALKQEEAILIEGLRKGDVQTLQQIYKDFFPPISSYLRKNGGNEEDAKDVFQEAVMVMYRLVQKEDFQLTASFLSLLYSISRNIWVKSLRKRPFYLDVAQPEIGEGIASPERNVEEEINARTIDKLFRAKLHALGEECRNILKLFFEGISMKDITAQLKLSSVAFAKKKKFQCKEKLVDLVKADPLFVELNA